MILHVNEDENIGNDLYFLLLENQILGSVTQCHSDKLFVTLHNYLISPAHCTSCQFAASFM